MNSSKTIVVQRETLKTPWGIKLGGGKGSGKPLSVAMVTNY